MREPLRERRVAGGRAYPSNGCPDRVSRKPVSRKPPVPVSPRRWGEFRELVTNNFRVIDPTIFWVLP